MGHISLFLVVRIKGKFPSWRPFYPKFSKQRNIKCLTEERTKYYQKKRFGVFIVLFISLFYARNPFHSSTFHWITMVIIWGGTIISGPFRGSFAVWGSFVVGDHLRYCTDLMSLMTPSLVTIAITVFKINTSQKQLRERYRRYTVLDRWHINCCFLINELKGRAWLSLKKHYKGILFEQSRV